MKKCAAILLLTFMLTFFFGCGGAEDVSSSGELMDLSSLPEEENDSWLQKGLAIPEDLTEDCALWAGEYLSVKHIYSSADAEEEIYCLDSGVCGHLFWYLCQSRESEYFLEIYDTISKTSTTKSIAAEELGITDEQGYLLEMDMLDATHYIFRWCGYEQNDDGMYHQIADRIIYTDLAGGINAVDFWEQYLEKGIMQEEVTELPLVQGIDWRCGKDGNICVIKQKNNDGFQLCLFAPNGELILEKDGTNAQSLRTFLRTSDGQLIFPVYDDSGKCYEFLWADTTGKELRSIARTEAAYPDIVQMYGMLGNDIYYRSQDFESDRIVKWNVISGRMELVFDLEENGLESRYEILPALREGQTPVLYLSRYRDGQRKEWLMTLQEQKPEEAEAVRVCNLTIAGESQELVKACALTSSMENPAFSYEYEDASAEESRTRALAELTQGKGADLLLVSLEDMYMLEEKGALLDIRELLPTEFLEELLPGALEIGTISGRLSGIPPTVIADTLVACTSTWPEDTWKLEDVIGLMENGKLTCAIRNLPTLSMGRYLTPDLTATILVKNSLTNSFLIDWENRKCHFDDDRFIRLLELCSTDRSGDYVDTDMWLSEGKDLVWGRFYNVTDLMKFYEHIGTENGQIVGYPTEGTGGSYLAAEGGVLVVNANADPEKAAYFLEILLGREIQSKTKVWSMSVRKLFWEDYIIEESDKFLYKANMQEMPVFSNGDTPFHQAKGFLESCTAAPFGHSQIKSILTEEIHAMYAESRSPKATAAAINNRVQLYLDEAN